MAEVDPGAARAERELVATDEEAPLRHLVAAEMTAEKLHPERPTLIGFCCDDLVFHALNLWPQFGQIQKFLVVVVLPSPQNPQSKPSQPKIQAPQQPLPTE